MYHGLNPHYRMWNVLVYIQRIPDGKATLIKSIYKYWLGTHATRLHGFVILDLEILRSVDALHSVYL